MLYRGDHVCKSRTFMKSLPRLFNSQEEEDCDPLVNMEVLKINKIQHPWKQHKILMKFRDNVKTLGAIHFRKHYSELRKKESSEKSMPISISLASSKFKARSKPAPQSIRKISSDVQPDSTLSLKVHDASAPESGEQLN